MFSRVLVCFFSLLLSCYVFPDDFWVKLIQTLTKKNRLVDLVAAPRFLGHFRIDPVDQIGHGIYPKIHVFSYPSRY